TYSNRTTGCAMLLPPFAADSGCHFLFRIQEGEGMITRREFSRLTLGGITFLPGYRWEEAATGAANSIETSTSAAAAAKHIEREWVKKAMINDLLDYRLKE